MVAKDYEEEKEEGDAYSDNATVLAKNHGSHIFEQRNSLLKSNASRMTSDLAKTQVEYEPGTPIIEQENDDIMVGKNSLPYGEKRPAAKTELRSSNPFPAAQEDEDE